MLHPSPIVIGYDGSPRSQNALRWAAAEAVRQVAPLKIVEAFELVIVSRPSAGHFVPLKAFRKARQEGLEVVSQTCRLQHPGLQVETSLVVGGAAGAVLDQAEHARLV